MAERDPTRPQLDFPALTAELITQLRLTGQIGLLDFSDQVTPVFLIGSRGIDFSSAAPSWTSASTFFGSASSPAANTVFADTGQLPAGTYDIHGSLSMCSGGGATPTPMVIEHRDAANAVTLATLLALTDYNFQHETTIVLPLMGYVLGLNERLRIKSPGAALVGTVAGVVFAQLRPTP